MNKTSKRVPLIYIILILLVLAVSMIILMAGQTSSYTSDSQYSPKNYPLSKWISTDGKVELYVGSDGKCYGFINSEAGSHHVYWAMNDHRMICIDIKYYYDDEKTPPSLENWELEFKENSFEATVFVDYGAYYDKYDTIVFNLVEENLNESDIPYPPNLSESLQTE